MRANRIIQLTVIARSGDEADISVNHSAPFLPLDEAIASRRIPVGRTGGRTGGNVLGAS